jgi:hypothetical protein
MLNCAKSASIVPMNAVTAARITQGGGFDVIGSIGHQ